MSDSRAARRRAEREAKSQQSGVPLSALRAAAEIAVPSADPSLAQAPAPAWLVWITVALATICLIGLFSTEAADTDFWWHLKTGQYLVQTHKLPDPDPFAYTTALNPPVAYPGEAQVRHFNLTHEWLAQALMYLIYSAGDIPGLVLFRAAILAAICGLAGFLAFWRSHNFYLGIVGAAATATITINFAADRPALLSFLFVAIFITILEVRRGLWILPVLGLIWANAHGGFFLGWVVLAAYCAGTLPIGPKAPTEDRKTLWMVTAATVVLSLLNPNGFGVLLTLLKYRGSAMQTSLIEWQSPYLWGPPYAFDVLLYLAAAVLLISWKRVRIADWILFVAFAAASLTAFRNIPLIGIIAPMLIAAYFPARVQIPSFVKYALPVLLAIALVAGAQRGSFFQLRASIWKFPSGAATFLLANRIHTPIFNTYEHGGYLMWRLFPQEQVFIDGRSVSEAAFNDYRQILYNEKDGVDRMAGARLDRLDHYRIDVVVMNTFEYISGSMYPLAIALADPAAKDWQIVYDDAQSLIFMRDPPPGILDLGDKVKLVFDHMENECLTHIGNSPDTPRCARVLADYWMRAGDKPRARGLLVTYLSHVTEKDEGAERALQTLNAPPSPGSAPQQ